MLKQDTKTHSKFLKVFNRDELNDIIDNATVVTESCIIISTEDNFFELSAYLDGNLDVYCNDNKDGTSKQLTKDEFMKLYKNSPSMELEHIIIDE